MTYRPKFTITPALLASVEEIARLRQRIEDSSVSLAWVPALQKDSRVRNAHASTAIEGNPLSLPEVQAVADGSALPGASVRSEREITNYLAAVAHIEQRADDGPVREGDLLDLHRMLARGVMDQGEPGAYRTVRVGVGHYLPPNPADVPHLTRELLAWWNGPSRELSPVLSSAILHDRFEAIHPFADVNGRTGRALALWDLYRRGFDTHHIFAVDEYYWEDRPAYYAALQRVHRNGDDLTTWLEYSATGLRRTLTEAWARIMLVRPPGSRPVSLRPKQERLLQLLSLRGSMAPAEIWAALDISKQGAMDLLRPLMEAGLVEKVGTKKTGRYRLVG